MKKINFSKEKEAEMWQEFKDGATLSELAQKFGCSKDTIRNFLEKEFEEYEKFANEHSQESCRKIGAKWKKEHPEELAELGRKSRIKWNKEHPEEHAEHARKIGQKWREEHPEELVENGRKVAKWNATHHNSVSRPEQAFFELLCSENPNLIILQQKYLKGLNHPFDIMIPELKQLIEIDGDYTHSRPGVPERDAEINEFVWRTYPDWQLFRYDDADLRKLGILK